MRWTEADVAAYQKRKGVPRASSGIQALKRVQQRSKLELALLAQMDAEKMETPHCEYRPLVHRRFRLDFAWPTPAIGVEVQGMVHRIKGRFKADIEKRAELLMAGWRVLEVDGDSIRDGRAIQWIKRLLE